MHCPRPVGECSAGSSHWTIGRGPESSNRGCRLRRLWRLPRSGRSATNTAEGAARARDQLSDEGVKPGPREWHSFPGLEQRPGSAV